MRPPHDLPDVLRRRNTKHSCHPAKSYSQSLRVHWRKPSRSNLKAHPQTRPERIQAFNHPNCRQPHSPNTAHTQWIRSTPPEHHQRIRASPRQSLGEGAGGEATLPTESTHLPRPTNKSPLSEIGEGESSGDETGMKCIRIASWSASSASGSHTPASITASCNWG